MWASEAILKAQQSSQNAVSPPVSQFEFSHYKEWSTILIMEVLLYPKLRLVITGNEVPFSKQWQYGPQHVDSPCYLVQQWFTGLDDEMSQIAIYIEFTWPSLALHGVVNLWQSSILIMCEHTSVGPPELIESASWVPDAKSDACAMCTEFFCWVLWEPRCREPLNPYS